MCIYLYFIQPKVWKYTVEILRPKYLHLDRIVLVEGVVLHREDIVRSPGDGIILKLKGDDTRVASGEVIGVIFPDMQSYKNYLQEIDNILAIYKKMTDERQDLIKEKTLEIEDMYKKLSKDNEICRSLIENKKDASDIIKELDQLNKDILDVKKDIEKARLEVGAINKERDNKLKDLESSIVTSYTPIHTDKAGVLMFSSDSKESFRNDIIQGNVHSDISVKDIFGKPKTISSGDKIAKGDIIGRVVDNLESFVVCNVLLDGDSSFTHNRIEIKGEDGSLILDIIKWIGGKEKETWIGKVVGNPSIRDVGFSGTTKVG
ncbi:MAG: HlyD family efflux transporter periplasmic adaptor subunit, partial [bacterium]